MCETNISGLATNLYLHAQNHTYTLIKKGYIGGASVNTTLTTVLCYTPNFKKNKVCIPFIPLSLYRLSVTLSPRMTHAPTTSSH